MTDILETTTAVAAELENDLEAKEAYLFNSSPVALWLAAHTTTAQLVYYNTPAEPEGDSFLVTVAYSFEDEAEAAAFSAEWGGA